jgi:hypothetical protein
VPCTERSETYTAQGTAESVELRNFIEGMGWVILRSQHEGLPYLSDPQSSVPAIPHDGILPHVICRYRSSLGAS